MISSGTRARAHPADLVLKQLAQRLYELEVHLFGEAPDVVVRLDDRRRTFHRHGLDNVRVESALDQVIDPAELARLFLKYLYELVAYDLALAFGVSDARESRQETLAGGYPHDVEVHLAVRLQHLLELILPEQPGVYEYAGLAVSYRAGDERGGDRGVDPPRQAADRVPVADLAAYLFDGLYINEAMSSRTAARRC